MIVCVCVVVRVSEHLSVIFSASSERAPEREPHTHSTQARTYVGSTIPSPGGKSKVTSILLSSTNEFKRLLKAGAGNTAALEDILKCVRAQLKVPLIQGCLEYGYKTRELRSQASRMQFKRGSSGPSARASCRSCMRRMLWTLPSFVWRLISCPTTTRHNSQKSSLPLYSEFISNCTWLLIFESLCQDPSFANIKAVFSAANLNKMGLSCADIGAFVDKSASTSLTTLGTDFVQCADGTISNTDADTAKCSGTWLTLKPGVVSASSRSSVPALWAVPVVLSALSAVTALNL